MEITISASGGSVTEQSEAVQFLYEALEGSYPVETLGGHRTLNMRGAFTTEVFLVGEPKPKPLSESGGSTVGGMKIEIDTSEVDAVLGKVEALHGCVTGYAIDPLESAIESAVRMLNDDRDRFHELQAKGFESGKGLIERLATHLDALLALQLKSLAENQLPKRQE